MYATSSLFDSRIKQGGMRKTVVDIYYNNILVASDLPVSSGTIRADRTADMRRTGSLALTDESLIPSLQAGGILEPYGTEFKVKSGIVYPNGTSEMIPLGVFVLDKTNWQESEGPLPSVELVDRSMIMIRAQIGPSLGASGKVASAFLNQIFAYFWPELTITYDPAINQAVRVPGGVTFDNGNHWDIMNQMASLMGGEFYFNNDGNPVCSPFPDFDELTTVNDAVYHVAAGETMVNAARSVSREDVYNSVYVVGQSSNSGPIPIGHVFNNDPASPTYREGPFRKMGIRIENNLLTTATQCRVFAQNELLKYRRLARTLSVDTLTNPALQEGDIIQVTYLEAETEPALVQSIDFPLADGTMNIDCAIQRL